jgi:hypothetical protein
MLHDNRSGRPAGEKDEKQENVDPTTGASSTSSRRDRLLDFSMVPGLRKN